MKTYTLKETAKKINIAPGIIRQWEKELNGLLEISRTKQGARIYSERELHQLLEIKALHSNKASKETIRDYLQKKQPPVDSIVEDKVKEIETKTNVPDPLSSVTDISLEIVEEPVSSSNPSEDSLTKANLFFEAMDTYKKTFLNEVKEEIRSVVRKEMIDEVKKEIKNGTYYTVKSLSDSIYKSTANTKAELEEISDTLKNAAADTNEKLRYLSNSVTNVSLETADEIFTLSKQLNENSHKLNAYFDHTNDEINQLAESISKQREIFVAEREEYRHDVRQREAAFRDMLANFRDAAAAKEKKWWKFWN